MKRLIKILFIAGVLLYTGSNGFSQPAITTGDTTKVSQIKISEQSRNGEGVSGQNQQGNINKQQGNSQIAKGNQKVKQVKSARPDMSRSKGARPNITRPSGSGIPKGVGKPGGIGKHGGR